ncbi:MAG TPA: hypothetical protein PKH04_02150 [Burkholderiaceae bacterium]|nr:hypothetical protein [Burkholderiaceae bacterium]
MKLTPFPGFLVVMALLAGCASGPVPPDWQLNVQGSTERAVEAYLTGHTRIGESEFARARTDIARTGKIDLIARVELIGCALRVASLVSDDCMGFDRISQDTGSAEQAYADYLAGRLSMKDVSLLPVAHRGVIGGGAQALQAIKDPLSRLIAAGVLFKMGQADPAVMAVAIDAASGQGWSRPLLAWLHVQARRAELAGDVNEGARIRRRIDLILQVPVRPL